MGYNLDPLNFYEALASIIKYRKMKRTPIIPNDNTNDFSDKNKLLESVAISKYMNKNKEDVDEELEQIV